MSSKIAVMADPDTVTGFMLGGIKDGFPVKNMEEARDKLKELGVMVYSQVRIEKMEKGNIVLAKERI